MSDITGGGLWTRLAAATRIFFPRIDKEGSPGPRKGLTWHTLNDLNTRGAVPAMTADRIPNHTRRLFS